MTLAEAIQNLTAGREDCGMIPEDEYTQTIDLAIEALKQIGQIRAYAKHLFLPLLPGETKD